MRIGEVVTIVVGDEDSRRIRKRKMRVVKAYRHFILFEDRLGIRECFTLWELLQMGIRA